MSATTRHEAASTGTVPRGSVFFTSVALYAAIFVFLHFLFPILARWIVGAQNNLPVPGTLLVWYMGLFGLALYLYLSSDQSTWEGFLRPVVEAIDGRSGLHGVVFRALFVLLPLFVGWQVFQSFVPHAELPSTTRQQHPGMSGAGATPYVGLKNPVRLNNLDRDEMLREGRALYQKNCRPCHGAGYDGAGPMASQFKLKPVAFIDPGTIATLVEDSVFWRVSEGGIGLPMNATPWDSPMPKWGDELSEDQRWKIIMAIYEDIGMEPRVLEMKVEE